MPIVLSQFRRQLFTHIFTESQGIQSTEFTSQNMEKHFQYQIFSSLTHARLEKKLKKSLEYGQKNLKKYPSKWKNVPQNCKFSPPKQNFQGFVHASSPCKPLGQNKNKFNRNDSTYLKTSSQISIYQQNMKMIRDRNDD